MNSFESSTIAEEANFNISGGGRLQIEEISAPRLELDLSGGGAATLWVEENLDVNLSGGSRAEYFGSPEITQNISGGSELSSLGDK